ncbi:Hypothetical predicted protein [Cloeon dipterum]|uniref:C-type lectin domain-containing protein n=1 Tax=Cloeon dipterum TaxID=197152 RepID=A0A8S1DQJ7_9INSE|nr:Hypothetical predicted protein [Cloeon dipterum]
MNARLAVANTEEEAILLSNLLQHSQTTFQEAWIGRYFDGNIWTTVDGIAVADSGYEGWADGEPNRLRRTRADNSIEFEACGSLHWNMQHNDDYCTSTHPFICEFYNSPCTNL